MVQVAMKHASAELTKTPTDGKGTFDFVVHAFEIDKDNERIKSFTGLPTELLIGYQHTNNLTQGIKDPGAFIGKAKVRSDPVGLRGSGVLDLANPMGMAVYERMLLPADDPLALNELSIGFAFDASATTRGPKGELVIPAAQLAELSVVHMGSQRTQVMNLKSAAMKAVDSSAWDVNAAVSAASTAAQYKEIAAGEHTIGTPDQRQHWFGWHHYVGKGPNDAGVNAALARIGATNADTQVQNVTDAELNKARGHLQDHKRQANPDYQPTSAGKAYTEEPLPTTTPALKAHLEAAAPGGHAVAAASVDKEPPAFLPNTHKRLHATGNVGHSHPGLGTAGKSVEFPEHASLLLSVEDWQEFQEKAGRELSAKNLDIIRQMHDLAHQLDPTLHAEQKADANGEEPQANPDEQGPDAELRRQLAAFIA